MSVDPVHIDRTKNREKSISIKNLLRRREGFTKPNNLRFLLRMTEQMFIWVVGALFVYFSQSAIATVIGVFLVGVVYARNLEFMHECIHNTAVTSRKWNTIFGTLLGIPMLTSFQDWKRSHLQHHADVSVEFQFQFDERPGILYLIKQYFMIGHLATFGRSLLCILFGKRPIGSLDYLLILLYLLVSVATGYVAHSWVPLMLTLVAFFPGAIINFHIQLPEHFDCDLSATDALANSRTIAAGRFAAWFVNNNNFHTSHHWMPNVPICRLPDVEAEIGDLVVEKSSSYWEFYRDYYKTIFKR